MKASSKVLGYLVLSLVLNACDDPGPAGPQGPAGPPGPAAPAVPETWVREGSQVKSGDSVSEVIVQKNATLTVNGKIYVEQDAKLLPRSKCVVRKLTDTTKDLGIQISALLEDYSCLSIDLPANTKWFWHEVAWLRPMQKLTISSVCPYPYSSANLSTEIVMEKEREYVAYGTKVRTVARLFSNAGAVVNVGCVKISAPIIAIQPVSVECGSTALFSLSIVDDTNSTYRFDSVLFESAENIVFSTGNSIVRFNRVEIKKWGSRTGDIQPVTNYIGWCPSLSGTTIVKDGLTLVGGVSLATDTSFKYLP